MNRANIASTCAKCHRGIYEQFEMSVHSPAVTKKLKKGQQLPVCSDCHTSHTIGRTDTENFRLTIMNQCGKCHGELAESYFETYHGKVSKLGFLKTAKCYDCHGAHDILPPSNPASHLSRNNIVETCAKCHGLEPPLRGLPHARDAPRPEEVPDPVLRLLAMTMLLVVTFVVAGLHTLAWLPRSLAYRKHLQETHALESKQHVRRFTTRMRNMHLMVISSFLTLAITGMTLKFSYTPWAYLPCRACSAASRWRACCTAWARS